MADGTDRRTPRPELRLVGGATPREEAGGDAALVRAFLAGDDDAFGELVRRHEAVVLRVLTRHAGPEDARDLAQRAFLRTFEAARRWRRDADVPFRAWVLRVAVNLARNRARDVRRWLRADEGAAADVPVAAVGTQAIEDEQHARALRAAVRELPRRQRDVVTLRVDAELSFAEIGQVLGITENNAKVHFHHASKRLREVLREGTDR